jgi:probable HAF family extracellular repeat protein
MSAAERHLQRKIGTFTENFYFFGTQIASSLGVGPDFGKNYTHRVRFWMIFESITLGKEEKIMTRYRTWLTRGTSVTLSFAVVLLSMGWSQSLTWLGTLGGSSSEGYGVSNNGVVVGYAEDSSNNSRAFRWQSGVMQDLGTLHGGSSSEAAGVSADGSVVVGDTTLPTSGFRAFRWTSSGMVDIGTLSGHNYAFALDVSADGSVVVGRSSQGFNDGRAFRWNGSTMQDLGALSGHQHSIALGVSGDGNVVVGWSGNMGNPGSKAFRWDSVNGMVDLGSFGGQDSSAHAASNDGSVVVGSSMNVGNVWRPFRWAGSALVDLGTLGGSGGFAYDVDATGTIVVGAANDSSEELRAFRWINGVGMQDLNAVYASLIGSGSWLEQAFSISPNGRYITGVGYNATTGQFEAYLLDTVPEPNSLLALGGGLAAILARRRRQR